MGGGNPTEVHILYPKTSHLQNLAIRKIPSVFFASANVIIYLLES